MLAPAQFERGSLPFWRVKTIIDPVIVIRREDVSDGSAESFPERTSTRLESERTPHSREVSIGSSHRHRLCRLPSAKSPGRSIEPQHFANRRLITSPPVRPVIEPSPVPMTCPSWS